MSMICEIAAIPDKAAREVVEHPRRIRDLLVALDRAGTALSLEKSWHGLHFVLTGTAWEGTPPLNFIAAGGETVGAEDVGYGPARVLFAESVRELDVALWAISEEEFDRRFDVDALTAADIYPQIWDEPRADLLEEYRGYFDELRKVVKQAARDKQALLITVR